MNVVCCRAPKDNTSKEVTGALDMNEYNHNDNNNNGCAMLVRGLSPRGRQVSVRNERVGPWRGGCQWQSDPCLASRPVPQTQNPPVTTVVHTIEPGAIYCYRLRN